jgi:hypothetical protein
LIGGLVITAGAPSIVESRPDKNCNIFPGGGTFIAKQFSTGTVNLTSNIPRKYVDANPNRIGVNLVQV